jgi:uncharacterized damage-inducible protein DinB
MNAFLPDDIAAVLRGLEDSPAILAAMVRAIPADRLHAQRRPGFWSLAGHVAHLAQVQPMLAERVRRILSEDNPEFVPFFPAKDGKEEEAPLPSVEQSLAAFAAGRRVILDLLQGAAPGDWRRTAVHPEYEAYGLAILARHILMHDHWHMYRMEEVWLTREAYLQPAEG